ncbi:MAG TPA: ABC transporter ATP-binding protein [Ilumatobacter sp.]|nr:ABC transporter ATP-binding protein [Ilumatobacter sp.]
MWATNAVSEEDRLDREEARQVLRRAAALARPQRRLALATLGFVALSTSTTLVGPLLLRYGIDDGIRADDAGPLNVAIVAFVAVAVVAYVGSRQQYVFVNRAGEGFLRALRLRLFDHIQRQSLGFFDRNKAGVLVSRMTADIESMSELVQWGLLQFVSATLLLTFALVVLLLMSWQLTLLALLVVPFIVLASIKFQRNSNEAYLAVRERVGENLSSLQENIAGVRVIQAYVREPEQFRRFRRTNRALYDAHVHSVRVATWYFGVVEFFGVLATAIAIGMGGWLVQNGQVSVGTVVAVVLLLSSLFEPVQQLSQMYNTLQSATASLAKMFEILDTVPEIDERSDAVALPRTGTLDVDHVTFSYPGTTVPVLHDVLLTVAPGERLALVGPTGAGKSTLAKLIARLYDPGRGAVRFAGTDLRSATLASLRERVVVVPQEGFLFDGTIADNLRLARPEATDDELRQALRALDALDRFEAFPDGLATEVRERGSRLSAGERQLVSLARAALVDPAVLVLDEATSSLDPGTEALVEHALDRLMEGRTTIVVAHRLSTVQRADRVAVVDHGRLAELGTHDELMALGGRYAALAEAWARSQPV